MYLKQVFKSSFQICLIYLNAFALKGNVGAFLLYNQCKMKCQQISAQIGNKLQFMTQVEDNSQLSI